MNQRANKTAWYEALYSRFDDYDDEPYTKHTRTEVDFVEELIGSDKGLNILDVGCGTGRHSLELARRGYGRVTGVDLSPAMLQQARRKAEAEKLPVKFMQRDARDLGFEGGFEAVLVLCEGGFSLMETDDMDWQILDGVSRALRPGGILIMTAPNAAFLLAQQPDAGAFDPLTLREQFTLHKDGVELACMQRYYTFPELRCLLQSRGFAQIRPFAVGGSGYHADRMPTSEEYEFGVIAVRSE